MEIGERLEAGSDDLRAVKVAFHGRTLFRGERQVEPNRVLRVHVRLGEIAVAGAGAAAGAIAVGLLGGRRLHRLDHSRVK